MENVKILVKKAQKGDLAAFEYLVKMYQRRVYGLSLQMLGHHDDAQDLAQEVFIRAYRSLGSFRNEADFGTWLHRITVNLCLNNKRSMGRASVVSLDEPITNEERSMQREIQDHRDDPLQSLEKLEFRESIKKTLNELSHDHRAVLVLREIHGYGYDEIASMLNCSLGTVKSRLNRARQAMVKKLKLLDLN